MHASEFHLFGSHFNKLRIVISSGQYPMPAGSPLTVNCTEQAAILRDERAGRSGFIEFYGVK
jgi:hypothetical protein